MANGETRTPLTELQWFVQNLCTGRQYDSCFNTPCIHSTGSGCGHPQHPKNRASLDRKGAE